MRMSLKTTKNVWHALQIYLSHVYRQVEQTGLRQQVVQLSGIC
jgi:hypothetical protein